MYKKSRALIICEIAGEQYYDYLEVINELKTGTKLKLELESDNPYDSNAVALYFNDKKLGYLPRRNNEIISTLLSYGYDDILETFYYSKNENTVPQIIIKIKEKNIN